MSGGFSRDYVTFARRFPLQSMARNSSITRFFCRRLNNFPRRKSGTCPVCNIGLEFHACNICNQHEYMPMLCHFFDEKDCFVVIKAETRDGDD